MIENTFNFQKIFSLFNYACGKENIDPTNCRKIMKEMDISKEIPFPLIGLCYDLTMNSPQYHWNRDVMFEVYKELTEFYKSNSDKTIDAFNNSQEHFFSAINSYFNIIKIYNELFDVAYEDELKTRIYRNPIYTQICEDCLMNFYRCIRNIIDIHSSENYSPQNTLGKIVPVLTKNNFPISSNININIRNAISHGNTIIISNEILFKYSEKENYITTSLKNWEYDKIINSHIDIAGGILVGFIKFIIENELLNSLLSSDLIEDYHFEWIKLFYRTQNTRILFINKATISPHQLNVAMQTSIDDKNVLIVTLIEIIKGINMIFPDYERYFISYNHNRSPRGFIRLNKNELSGENNIGTADLLKKVIENNDLMIWDIQNYEVDEIAYKFNVFTNIKRDEWELNEIRDCSIQNHKRIKANLILKRKMKSKEIKIVLKEAIEKIRILKTPRNPREDVPFGDLKADIVFLNVFYLSYQRDTYNISPNNKFFICLANYYKSNDVPKLKHGGLPKNIWKQLKKENIDKIQIAWNTIINNEKKG